MKKTIVFDFDGVIHQKYNGYKDGSIYGTINYELLNYIKELLKDYYIVISSNRPAKQIVDYMNNNTDLDFEIFNKDDKNLYWEKDNIIGVTNQKAIGILYIDDRAFRYDKNKDTKHNIENIKMTLKNINNEVDIPQLISFVRDKIQETENAQEIIVKEHEVNFTGKKFKLDLLNEILDFVNKGGKE